MGNCHSPRSPTAAELSDHLYFTRLRWDGSRGIAKLHGRTAQLTRAPDLGIEFTSIDYVPEVACCLIRHGFDREIDMTPPEVAACDSFLHSLFGE